MIITPTATNHPVFQDLTTPGIVRSAQDTTPVSSNFEELLRGLLTPNEANQVNEEELFAALIHERLAVHKGESAAGAYGQALAERKVQLTRSDGYIPVEQAAEEALAGLVRNGLITQSEHDLIYTEAFNAAQLDDNKAALYDGRGSASDPTIAIADLEAALLSSKVYLSGEALQDSAENGVPQDVSGKVEDEGSGSIQGNTDITPEGNNVDGPEGFVFKPESDGTRNLVVLLPANLAYQVEKLVLKDESDKEIEQGQSSGYANGGREHFRFQQPGSKYPDNITVEITLLDGDTMEYLIPNPGQRYD